MSVVEIVIKTIDQSGGDVNKLTSSLGELAAKYVSIGAVAGTAYKIAGDSIKEFTESAMAAKQLSRASGESIENASRFIEVLDDFNVSQQDALAATRALTKQGLAPNIETLAKLSDQYREIKDPQEKNEFILKNLGRAGLQWAQVLEQGSDALHQHAAAISKNLIITEDMWQRAEKLRIAQDDLNDSWRAAKIRIGEELVPALSGLLNFTNNYNAAQETEIKGWERLLPPIAMVHGAIIALTESSKDNKNTTDDLAKSQSDLTGEIYKTEEELKNEKKAAEEAAKALTEQLQGYLSLASNLYEEQKNYTQSLGDLQKERKRIIEDMANAEEESNTKASRAAIDYKEKLRDINEKIDERKKKDKDLGDLIEQRTTLERHYAETVADGLDNTTDKANDYKEKLAEIDDKIQETERAHHLALGKMSYDLIVTKLSADGLTTAEYDIAVQAGLTFGVFDQQSADAAVAMNHLTDQVASGKISVYEYGQIIQNAMQGGALNAAELQRTIAMIPDHKYIEVVASFVSSVPETVWNAATETQTIYTGTGQINRRAAGGPVMAGFPYLVGERGPEMVVPNSGGNVISNSNLSNIFDYSQMGRAMEKAFSRAMMKAGG